MSALLNNSRSTLPKSSILTGSFRPKAALVIPQNIHDQSDFERQE